MARASRPKESGSGFSLTELLIVLAVVLLLTALLLPALQGAREAARRISCQNNVRNLAMATQNFVTAHRRFPPAATYRIGQAPGGRPDPARHSLITYLLPYFEQSQLYQQLDLSQDWNSPENYALTRQDLGGILICPSAPGGREQKHVSDYSTAVRVDPSNRTGLGFLLAAGRIANRAAASTGPDWGAGQRVWDGVLQLYLVDHLHRTSDRRVVRPRHVRDGLSHTLLILENAGKPLCYEYGRPAHCKITRFRWASPTLWMTINDRCGGEQLVNCNNNSQPYAFHPQGLNVAHADGSVHFYHQDIAPDLFVARVTLAASDRRN